MLGYIGKLRFAGLGILRESPIERGCFPLGNEPAGNMPAIFHQIKIIQRLQRFFPFLDRLEQLLIKIVGKHQDMRQLQRRIAAHAHTRRDTLHDGFLRRTDRAVCAFLKAVRLQIDHADHAFADRAVFERTLNIDIGIGIADKAVFFHILPHRFVDGANVSVFVVRPEQRLRQNEAKRRRSLSDKFADAVPVSIVRRKLITGDHRPLGKIVRLRQKNICG